ncbi:tRNA/tmRNA (uracil-C(5))-methyltransferase [Sinobacterium norvegicum]|uniref:tRNA/tmRNA (uracil-C(5))-methyltransferase n=1 Tax=Sinobacterium norvegicum TaxID=1641715 RepID=A0ABM9AAX6_9GAMM|nr:tRNA (uridine(54)-C5)-methyltransferase TrmA [Sinobacterium norvegicum]CAH0990105.1 tRNA/tmRNA (uracil-C(5))-methyltransferase [Sinobacterium norvegicum]
MPLSQFKPEQYDQLLNDKVATTRALFDDVAMPEAEVFASDKQYYRMRTEFKVWHQDDELYYVMFNPAAAKKPVRVDSFPVAGEAINTLMPVLIEELKSSTTLRHRLFQVEFLSTLAGDMLVTLIYHRQLDDQWISEATALKKRLGIDIIGRARKMKICLDRDFVIEKLPLSLGEFSYKQVEGGFTQPNAKMNCSMINWAVDASKDNGGDLVELYCGNGNFTLPLSRQFDKVLATEISKTSVHSAQYNIAENNIDNLTIIRMSSEEFTQALNGEREFRRLKGVDLDSYQFSTVLVDPPRAGLDSETVKLVQRFDNILYVSCNPHTLAENLTTINQTHEVVKLAFFDQFPYTHHMETGVYLKRRDS